MSVDSKLKYLAESLKSQIESFHKRRTANKKRAFWIRMLATSFSAATTILLGLQGLEYIKFIDASLIVKNVALVLSAFVTLFGAWDAFFNHRALWIRYTKTLTELVGIKAELEYLSSGNEGLKEEEIDRLFQKFQAALEETNSFWQSLRDDNASKKPSEPATH